MQRKDHPAVARFSLALQATSLTHLFSILLQLNRAWLMPHSALDARLCCATTSKRACQELRIDTMHHADADSFRQALKLECPFCVRIWMAMGRPTEHSGTRFHPPFMVSNGTFRINFWDADEGPGDLTAHGNGLQIQLSLVPIHGGSTFTHYVSQADNTTLAIEFPAQQASFSLNTRADSALDFLSSCLHQCRSSHARCQLATSSKHHVPKRVVEIDGSMDRVRVRERKTDADWTTPYAALSHCWGVSQILKLTKETTEMLQDGLPIVDLPRTF